MKLLLTVFLIVVVNCLTGCDLIGKHSKSKNSISQIDHPAESELRQSLENFQEFFANTIIDASDEIDRLSPDIRPNWSTLRLKSVTIKASDAMLRQDDSLNAFIDVWVLSARLTDYFESGFGKKSFEPNQQIVIEACRKNLVQIENLGLEYLGQEHFEKTRVKVYEFARENPVQPGYKETVLFATEAYEGRPSPFEEIITLPLIPLAMVNGMTETVTGAPAMSKSVDRFADTIEAFPESAKWQLLMLLYDIEKNATVKSTVSSFSDFASGTSRLADSAEKLPEELRLNISSLLVEIEEKSPEIHKLLQSADSALDNTTRAIDSSDKLVISINDMCDKIVIAADAWKGAADSTDAAVSSIQEINDSKTSSDKGGFDVDMFRETVGELNTLVDKLVGAISKADAFTRNNYMRFGYLILFFFAGLFVYKLAMQRLDRNPKRKRRDKTL
jgi:hypothetical protein